MPKPKIIVEHHPKYPGENNDKIYIPLTPYQCEQLVKECESLALAQVDLFYQGVFRDLYFLFDSAHMIWCEADYRRRYPKKRKSHKKEKK